MTPEQILEKHIGEYSINAIHPMVKQQLINALIEFARYCCEKQKEVCYNSFIPEFISDDVIINRFLKAHQSKIYIPYLKQQIINSPLPKELL